MSESQQSTSSPAQGALKLSKSGFNGLVSRIEEVHVAIAKKPYQVAGRVADDIVPVSVVGKVQLGITQGVYSAVRGVSSLVLGGAGLVEKQLPEKAGKPNKALELVNSAINGAFGDYLVETENPLAIEAAFYHQGERLELTSDAIKQAHSKPTKKVAVFLHGLACNESGWNLFAEKQWGEQEANYAVRLQEDKGFSVFHVRYNTGLRIAENGQQISQLLDELVANYPECIEEFVLIGHSMGGLVSRSACHHAADENGAPTRAWAEQVTQVVCIGSPHHGSPLEQVANIGTALLGQLDITAPFSKAINLRSIGVKDLRFGYLDQHDWKSSNPDLVQDDGRTPARYLKHAQYNFIYSSVTEKEESGLANTLGDWLVNVDSGAGRHAKPEMEASLSHARTAFIGGLNHMQLLNHPKVYQQLDEWLD